MSQFEVHWCEYSAVSEAQEPEERSNSIITRAAHQDF